MNFEVLNSEPTPEELSRQKEANVVELFTVPADEEDLKSFVEESRQHLQEEEFERYKRRQEFLKKTSRFIRKNITMISVVIFGALNFPAVKKSYEMAEDLVKKTGIENLDDSKELATLSYDLGEKVGFESLRALFAAHILNSSTDFLLGENETEVVFGNESVLDPEIRKFILDLFSEENQVFPVEELKEVDYIVFSKELEKMPENYGQELSQNSHVAGRAENLGKQVKIYFNKDLYGSNNTNLEKKFDAISIAKTMFHEIAHCNDWERDSEMSLIERLKMLELMVERVKSEDRFLSNYVETIKNPNGEKETLYLKAIEYWAEIAAQYFAAPEAFKVENPIDFKIVDEFIKKQNPGFDIFATMKKIQKIANQDFDKASFKAFEPGGPKYFANTDYDYTYDSNVGDNKYSKLDQDKIGKRAVEKMAENKKLDKKPIKKAAAVKKGHPFK